jgi:hypothetical protein
VIREPLPLVLAKALIAATGVAIFLLPLATPPGLLAGLAGTIAGYVLARGAAARGLRLGAGLVLAALTGLAASFAAQGILDASVGGTGATLAISDALYFGAGCLALFFGVRLLSQRWRVFAIVELAVVVGAVAHTFADHRNLRIHQPRFLSDWAWSQGLDPTTLLAGAGVAALAVAVVLLIRARRAAKLLLTLLLLLGGALLAYLLGARTASIRNEPDTNGLALSKNDKEKDKDGDGSGGGSGARRRPEPVAVVLLHDDLPDVPILYFRQAVLSRFAVDRLVEDRSGRFDRDVITAFPAGAPRRVESPQASGFHRELTTSMFLLADHAQPFGVGHPVEIRPLENPDPRRFVVAYDVTSAFSATDPSRLVGRGGAPASWSEEERRHYTALPADPRYLALANRLVRDMDPRFVGDDVMKAFAIKRYLEKEGFYSLAQKQLVGDDPTAKFLFGDLRGYCVHFAHAATLLLRSQGIPARVALGYAVQTTRRGAGSSLLILGNEAHAWPEMYVDGVGWVTFDIYPERSDEPPPPPFDGDLESVLGELARKDRTGGRAADPSARLVIPWAAIGGGLAATVGGLLLLGYGVKLFRRLRAADHRLVYRAVLDRLSDLGAARRPGETRERHAQRLAALSPTFPALTRAHLRLALGRGHAREDVAGLAREVTVELRRNLSFWTRLGAAANPFGWLFTR